MNKMSSNEKRTVTVCVVSDEVVGCGTTNHERVFCVYYNEPFLMSHLNCDSQ
jgi:hypothetical protein